MQTQSTQEGFGLLGVLVFKKIVVLYLESLLEHLSF